MSKVLEEFAKEYAAEERAEGKAEGIAEKTLCTILNQKIKQSTR